MRNNPSPSCLWDHRRKLLAKMTPEEFVKHYPYLTREQIAEVACCSVATVNRWFMRGETRQAPQEHHKRLLAQAHYVWQNQRLEPQHYQELRRMMAG